MKKEQTSKLRKIINDCKLRTILAKASHQWFFAIYFGHYMQYPTASFQKEIFAITEDPNIRNAVIVAFRGSAKSTIVTMSYPIWAILGKQQKKFVVLLGQTQRQAKQHLINLKRELESNDLLRIDLGPFEEKDDEWGSYSLVIPKYNARITAASSEQSIRGLRHGQYRPDLLIADDVEDLDSVKTKEGRDKIHQWLTGDVIPAGDQDTRLIIVGNLLHEDSLLMRLKKSIEDKKLDGIFKSYPLFNENQKVLWPGRFPTPESIERRKKSIGNEISWQREFLLRIIPDTEQVVHPNWIHYYDSLPEKNLCEIVTGMDLAISQKSTADYTAMVSAKIYTYDEGRTVKIYILPNPINERLTFPQTVEKARLLSKVLGNGIATKLYVEDVGYQSALVQQLEHENLPAEGVKVYSQDKRSRLALTTSMIKNGKILFPRKGAENLIQQLVGFGIEKHDDLADAFSLLVLKIADKNYVWPSIWWI